MVNSSSHVLKPVRERGRNYEMFSVAEETSKKLTIARQKCWHAVMSCLEHKRCLWSRPILGWNGASWNCDALPEQLGIHNVLFPSELESWSAVFLFTFVQRTCCAIFLFTYNVLFVLFLFTYNVLFVLIQQKIQVLFFRKVSVLTLDHCLRDGQWGTSSWLWKPHKQEEIRRGRWSSPFAPGRPTRSP